MKSFTEIDVEDINLSNQFSSFKNIYKIGRKSNIKQWLYAVSIVGIILLFLPWTQNIRAKGNITTLRQEQRLQEVNTVIAGKVLKWYIKEGDFVNVGDTLLQLGETKVEYFDPLLLSRTQQQITAKEKSIESYRSKAATAEKQIEALKEGKNLKLQSLNNKLQQQQLKVEIDSNDLVAAKNEFNISKRQIEAGKTMLDGGAISLVDFEKRKVSFQNIQSKRNGIENKYLQSKQELVGLRIEKNSAIQDYIDKISKTEGEMFTSLSNVASTESEVSKLQNVYASYTARSQYYYIIAPQSGQIIKAKKEGIGEMLKEGETVAEIVPTTSNYAVEMYVEPMNIPLINLGQKVRFVFDGFPAILFSGWPKNSYGTFGGKVVAIESSLASNGKYRILVAEDSTEKRWPKEIRLGCGATGIALLKDVPIYYELWRNINGFPADFYKPSISSDKDAKANSKDKETSTQNKK